MRLVSWVGLAAVSVFDLLCPPGCLLCGAFPSPEERTGDRRPAFCPDCLRGMPALPSAHCVVCGRPFPTGLETVHTCGLCRKKAPPFERAVAAGLYEDALRRAIHAFKFRDRTELAGALAGLMAERLSPPFYPPETDYVVPVPLHPKRLRRRGFNQSLLLAEKLYGKRKGPVRFDLLRRSRWTVPQVRLTGLEREQNVRLAFDVPDPSRVKGRRIILLDDVYTTGSTMKECARTLKKAGAAEVLVVTLARVG